MNDYMKMQITNMIRYIDGFEDACRLAAMKDDGVIDKTENKQLEKIAKACQHFKKELENIR